MLDNFTNQQSADRLHATYLPNGGNTPIAHHSQVKNHSGFQKNKIAIFGRLCLAALLCLLSFGSAFALEIDRNNAFWLNYGGYEADRGYYIEFKVYFNSHDNDWVSSKIQMANANATNGQYTDIVSVDYNWGVSNDVSVAKFHILNSNFKIRAIGIVDPGPGLAGHEWVDIWEGCDVATKSHSFDYWRFSDNKKDKADRMYGFYIRIYFPINWCNGTINYIQAVCTASAKNDWVSKGTVLRGRDVNDNLTANSYSPFPNIYNWTYSQKDVILWKDGWYDTKLKMYTLPGADRWYYSVLWHGDKAVASLQTNTNNNESNTQGLLAYTANTDVVRADKPTHTEIWRIGYGNESNYPYTKEFNVVYPHVQTATSVTVTQSKDGWEKYTIGWKKDDPDYNSVTVKNENETSANVSTIAGGWKILYKIGTGAWNTAASNLDIGASSYTFSLPTGEQNKGTKNYTFMVQRQYFNNDVALAAKDAKDIYTNKGAPENLSITPVDNDRIFKVKWEIPSGSDSQWGNFKLYYRIQTTDNAKVTLEGATPHYIGEGVTEFECGGANRYLLPLPYDCNFSAGQTAYEYNFEIPEGQLEKGLRKYEFVVQREYFNNCSNFTSTDIIVNTDKLTLSGITATLDTTSNNIRVSTIKAGGRWNKASNSKFKFQIYRSPDQSNWTQSGGDMQNIDTVYIDAGASSCTPYYYQVRLFYNNAPYSTTTTTTTVMKSNTVNVNNVIEELRASKGFYNNKVEISWKPKAGNSFDSYTLSRRLKGVTNAIEQVIYQVTATGLSQYAYTDPNAIPGLYYEYTVSGNITCEGKASAVSNKSTTGFIQPYGVVSGQITYEGGTAVAGVQVGVQPEGDFQNRSLLFNKNEKTYLETNLATPFPFDNLSVQFLLNPSDDNTSNAEIISFHGDSAFLTVTYTPGNYIRIALGGSSNSNTSPQDKQANFNYTVPKNKYTHVSLTFQFKGTALDVDLYIDGVAQQKITVSNITCPLRTSGMPVKTVRIGSWQGSQSYWDGNIDELRVWDRLLTENEIKSNCDRYITGKENGLMLYYRFDEPTGNEAFDISGRNGVYNENHGVLSVADDYTHSLNVPSVEQLAIKGVTDANGNYIISTIPYSGEGSTVLLQPVLGVHFFNPTNKPLYFNQQSSTYVNVDFRDISSFKVKGHVYYENSTYPVEGAMLKIDGAAAVRDGAAITTEPDGSYEINVPIGKHWISAEKTGHVFVNELVENGALISKTIRSEARYPAYKEGLLEQPKHNFLDSISGIDFYDATLVHIVGRVAGGDIEKGKQLGFGLSKANIGSATLTLKNSETQYAFSNKTHSATLGDNRTSTTDIATTAGTGTFAIVKTDPVTGEFMATIPPIPFDISNVVVPGNNVVLNETGAAGDVFSYSKIKFDINPTKVDTLKFTDTDTQAVSYLPTNDSLLITRYNEPVLTVSDRDAQPGMWGDSVYYFANALGKDTISLYQGSTYTYGHPVFSQATYLYTWDVAVFERYENKDAAVTVYDTVPKSGLMININNGLSAQTVLIDTTGVHPVDSLVVTGNSLTLDSIGKATYGWTTGFPKIAGDKLLSVSMNFEIGGKTYPAAAQPFGSGSGALQAYLLGSVPSNGSNFVTVGPDAVDIVLHDPPGSKSYAYIERGTVTTTTQENTFDVAVNEDWTHSLHLGPKTSISTGIGVETETELQVIADLTGSAGGTQSWSKGNKITKTLNINRKISTSDDLAFVGSKADIYIGTSSNITFGQVRRLSLYPQGEYAAGGVDSDPISNSNGYSLFAQEKVASDQTFQTVFTYTQDYIIKTQIPNMKSLRNSLIDVVTSMPADNQNLNWQRDGADVKQLYFSTLPKTDENFGKDNMYEVFYRPGAADNEKVDEVSAYNRYIKSWEDRIKGNEEDKVKFFAERAGAEASGKMANHSFDAGVKYAETITVEYDSVRIDNSGNNWHGEFTVKGGFKLNEMGFDEEFKVGRQNTDNDKSETGAKNSAAFGYELAESGSDALTVDVYSPVEDAMKAAVLPGAKLRSLHGYMFQTRAGQTSCPYEGSDSTLYYRDSNGKAVELNKATFQTEKPELYINNAKSANAANISSGREATFTLELQNLSESHLPVTYNLSVVDNSNPSGLILSIDGMPLTVARPYTIDFGTPVTKTLKVKQSSQDILDYGDIKLSLASACDDKISSEVKIASLVFVPSSPESHLAARTALVNIEGSADGTISSDTAVVFTISDYDMTFRNFADLMLQYKSASATVWNTAQVFAYYDAGGNTLSNMADAIHFTSADATLSHRFSMKTLPDGAYDFRVLSRTKYGASEFISQPSNVERVIKDITAPKQFGAALPLSGILTADGEVSITFNEDIQNGLIQDVLIEDLTNIEVKAIKNGSVISHNTALKLNGGAPASTEAHIALENTSFTVEAYFRRDAGRAGALIAHGSDLSIGFNANNRAVVNIGGQQFVSDQTFTDDTWSYLIFAYSKGQSSNTFGMKLLSQATSLTLTFSGSVAPAVSPAYTGTGRLFIGNNDTKTDGITADIHEISLWNYVSALNHKDGVKAGNEQGLLGYWQLGEGHGTTGADKARSRHLTLPAPNMWYSIINNYAALFNGAAGNYVEINATETGITTEDDFALEFWFFGAQQANATLFSCGDGVLDAEPQKNLSVGYDANGKLVLRSNGTETILSETNYLDNSWHHFALNILRQGSNIAYVDGVTVKQLPSAAVDNVSGSKYVLGARDYNKLVGNGLVRTTDNYFTGAIDEFRVWNGSLTGDIIRENIHNQLRGNEAGLVAYYPFNKQTLVSNQPTTVYTLENFAPLSTVRTVIINGNDTTYLKADSLAVLRGAVTLQQAVAPTIKPVKALENVAHNFVADNRKIIINITEAPSLIEGTTLEISVKNILDLNGNKSKQSRWTAFVNRNRLNWSENNVDLVKEYLAEKTFDARITNNSGTTDTWTIGNLPAWLSASKTSGTLAPLSSEVVTFTVPASTPVGHYEETVYMQSSSLINVPLGVSLKVTGARPDWSVNPADWENSMTVTGQIHLKGIPQEDTEDLLAAFVGDTCVGLTSPVYVPAYDAYYTFLTVYGNAATAGEAIKFKIWDASTGDVYSVIESKIGNTVQNFTFTADARHGTSQQPVIHNATGMLERSIDLQNGWNWISVNVLNTSPAILQQFKDRIGAAGEMLKGQSGYLQNPSWTGTLTSIEKEQMYIVKTNAATTLHFDGMPAVPAASPIALANGWTWIGYIPRFTLPVNEALADLDAASNDQIKGQATYRIYAGPSVGWIGTLHYLRPGEGYMYYSGTTASKTFNYPAASSQVYRSSLRSSAQPLENHWETDACKYSGSMTMTSVVLENNAELQSDLIEIAAFAANGECRGSIILQNEPAIHAHPYLGFLTVFGEQGENLTLKVYDHATDREYAASNVVTFTANAMHGTPADPYRIQYTPTGIDKIGSAQVKIYPNPVENELHIANYGLQIEDVKIYDALGRLIKIHHPAPNDDIQISVGSLTTGIYTLYLTTDKEIITRKFVKK